MTPPARPDLAATLVRLRERFLATSDRTLARFGELATRLEADPSDAEAVRALHVELHRTHGTAGSYGFHAASRVANALEVVTGRWLEEPGLDLARRAPVARRFTEALGAALHGGTPGRRRVLLVGVGSRLAALATEAMERGIAPEPLASTALAGELRAAEVDGKGIVGVVAGAGESLPELEGSSVPIARIAADGDARAAITAACGSSS